MSVSLIREHSQNDSKHQSLNLLLVFIQLSWYSTKKDMIFVSDLFSFILEVGEIISHMNNCCLCSHDDDHHHVDEEGKRSTDSFKMQASKKENERDID